MSGTPFVTATEGFNPGGMAVFTNGNRASTVPAAGSMQSTPWLGTSSSYDPYNMNITPSLEPGFSTAFDPMSSTPGLQSTLFRITEDNLSQLETSGYGAPRPVTSRLDAPMNGQVTTAFSCFLDPDRHPWPLGSPMFGIARDQVSSSASDAGMIDAESLVSLNFRLAYEVLGPFHPEKKRASMETPEQYLSDAMDTCVFMGFLAELRRSSDMNAAVFAVHAWGDITLESGFYKYKDGKIEAPGACCVGGFVFGLAKAGDLARQSFEFGTKDMSARVLGLPTASGGTDNQLVPHILPLATHGRATVPQRADVPKILAQTHPTDRSRELPMYWVPAFIAKSDFDAGQVKNAGQFSTSASSVAHPMRASFNRAHVEAWGAPVLM